MKNGWTGGQYSIYRFIFGAYLLFHFAAGLFSNRSGLTAAMLLIATAAAIFFAIGLFDRTAALVLCFVLACTFGLDPLIANPSLLFVGGLLLAHVFLPPAPYGSVAARKRIDPRGGWVMPAGIFAAAWIVMSLGHTYGGVTKLVSLARPSVLLAFATWAALATELLFAPLALFRRTRPWVWCAAVAMHLALMTFIDFADLSFGMIVLHLFTFDPAWVPRFAPERRDLLLYDGTCGLCHRAVRFVVAEDVHAAFSFEPLPADEPQESVVIRTEDGLRLVRSDAVIYMLRRLGGLWRVFGTVFAIAPRGLRDACYDLIARWRYRLFARPAEACPMLPPDLRSRFTVH